MEAENKRKQISEASKCFDRFFQAATLELTLQHFKETIDAAGINYDNPRIFYPKFKVQKKYYSRPIFCAVNAARTFLALINGIGTKVRSAKLS